MSVLVAFSRYVLALNKLSYEKCACIMLMKLMAGVYFINILCVRFSYETAFLPKCNSKKEFWTKNASVKRWWNSNQLKQCIGWPKSLELWWGCWWDQNTTSFWTVIHINFINKLFSNFVKFPTRPITLFKFPFSSGFT